MEFGLDKDGFWFARRIGSKLDRSFAPANDLETADVD
jgi:hypothetical protein